MFVNSLLTILGKSVIYSQNIDRCWIGLKPNKDYIIGMCFVLLL